MTPRATLLTMLLVVLVPAAARAQDAPAETRPQPFAAAAVSVERAAEVDEFMALFLGEIVRGRLGALGFASSTPRVTERETDEAPRFDCVGRAACATRMVTEIDGALVVALRLDPGPEGEGLSLRWRIGPGEPREGSAEGDEGALATALQEAIDALDPAALPCVVTSAGDARARFQIDGAPVTLPTTLGPGAHPARAEAPDRGAWTGELSCAGGRLLRLRAE